MSTRTSSNVVSEETGKSPVRGYVFAFSAAIAYSASQVVARHGVSDFQAPMIGTTIALAFASLGFILIMARNLDSRPSDVWRGSLFFGAAGIFSAVGIVAMLLAVEHAEVVIVSPVSSTNPLFTLLFAAILLRDLERLTARILIGSTLVFAGVVLISIA